MHHTLKILFNPIPSSVTLLNINICHFLAGCPAGTAAHTHPQDPHRVRGPGSQQGENYHLHLQPPRLHPQGHMITMTSHTQNPPHLHPPTLLQKATLMTSTKVPLYAKWEVRKCQTVGAAVVVVVVNTPVREIPIAVRAAEITKSLERSTTLVGTGTVTRTPTFTLHCTWGHLILGKRQGIQINT